MIAENSKTLPWGVSLLKEGCFKCPRYWSTVFLKNKTAVRSLVVARCAYCIHVSTRIGSFTILSFECLDLETGMAADHVRELE